MTGMKLHGDELTKVYHLPWDLHDVVSGEEIGSNHSHLSPGKAMSTPRVSTMPG